MIKKLQNNDAEVSKKIHSVFQVSYAVEAKLLNATDFPPLKRSIANFVESRTAFYGYFVAEKLAGVIEIEHNASFTSINSLVVAPNFFRRGIGSQLIKFVFNTYNSEQFVVETGLENGPATKLYKSFGFKEVKQWDTDFGIRKIKFERNNTKEAQNNG